MHPLTRARAHIQTRTHTRARMFQLLPAKLLRYTGTNASNVLGTQESVDKNIVMQEWHDRLAAEAAVTMMVGRVDTCVVTC